MTTKKKILLLIALMAASFVPSVYETVKMFFISNAGGSFDILGQLEWYDIINETLEAFLITPMYFLLADYVTGKDKQSAKTAIMNSSIAVFVIYALFSIISYIFASNMLSAMEFTGNIQTAASYLRLETIAFVITILGSLCNVLFVLIGKPVYFYVLLVVRVLVAVLGDVLLIPTFTELGVGYANIISSIVCLVASLLILKKEDLLGGKPALDKTFVSLWLKVGLFSGLQIFINNIVYALVIVRMVNAVSESGNYWAANNFIWGWLLIPAIALAEIIKRDCSETKKPDWKFYNLTNIITVVVWMISIPLWKMLFINVFGIENPDMIFSIVLVLIPFYIAYIFSSEIEAVFVGFGKTRYLTVISAIVNFVYYGIMYLLFKAGVFEANMLFIEMLFGFGMVFGLLIYLIILRKTMLSKGTTDNTCSISNV